MSNNDPNQPGQPYNPDSAGQGSQQNPYSENPYGQNSYGQQPSAAGQNPYGQNPNPYGQPQAPGYDHYAAQGGYAAVQPPVERPRTLAIAFGLIMLAGIFSALSSWLMATSNMMANMIGQQWSLVQEEFQNQMQSTPGMNEDPLVEQMMQSPEAFMAQVNSMISSFVIVGMIITLGLYFLVGFFVGRGVGGMRILATILAALSLLNLVTTVPMVSMFADTQAGLINAVYVVGILLGVAGVVFAWLRPSSEYIAQRRMARRAGYR